MMIYQIKILGLFLFLLSSFGNLSANEKIRREVLRGKQIRPYVEAMAKLAVITFKEPPYLYEGFVDAYKPFFQNYADNNSGVACLLFDGDQLVGMASGVGLDKARSFYQFPFSNKGYDLKSIYNLGEVLVLKEYRGRGFGPELYKKLEQVVKTMPQYQFMTFCTYPDNWSIKNNLEDSDETFWKNENFFENKNIYVDLDWKEVGQKVSSPHKLFFWVKRLR